MVELDFEVEVEAEFEVVWKYFLDFATIPEWDPNVKGCKVIKRTDKEIGSTYEIISLFNGRESTVIYETLKYEISKDQGYIYLLGKNARITADDEIIITRKGPKLTTVIYKADICLRGLLCFVTPCIRGSLGQLAIDARDGVVKRSIERWGKARAIK